MTQRLDSGKDDLYSWLELPCLEDGGDKVPLADIKRAYRRLALRYHPDKLTKNAADKLDENSIAHAKLRFEQISRAYHVLCDEKKRKQYNLTGSVSDSIWDDQDAADWKDYFDQVFNKISTREIQEFSRLYRYSEEERLDVLYAYYQTSGDFEKMLELVMLSEPEDEKRFKKIVLDAVEKNEEIKLDFDPSRAGTANGKQVRITRFDGCSLLSEEEASDDLTKLSKSQLKKRKSAQRKREREAKEAEELAAELGISVDESDSNLRQLIQSKNQSKFDSMISSLEQKYAPKKPKKKKQAKK